MPTTIREQLESKIERSRLRFVEPTIYGAREPIVGWKFMTGKTSLEGLPQVNARWKAVEVGHRWGERDQTAWFAASVTIPKQWKGRHVVALINTGGECLAFVNGKPAQGLERNRSELTLALKAEGGEHFEIMVEAWATLEGRKWEFTQAEIAVVNPEVRDLWYNVRTAYEALGNLPEHSRQRMRMANLINEALNLLDLQHVGTPAYLESVKRANQHLMRHLPGIGGSLDMGKMVLAGHSHIDTAWLWTLAETRRKCGRTFASVLKNMEEFPEYKFSQSQPQLYKFVKQNYPDLYEGIKQRVAEGRWEPLGAAWVECDCNVPSGEAMIRQFLYGKKLYREEFGRDSVVGWWPDAFGYTWAMPQILKKCGMEYMVSTKIGWNQYDRFPYDLFWWTGVDGTRVLTCFPYVNYNGNPIPKDLKRQWDNFLQKDQCDTMLFSFGWGDGGGGPTKEMIEYGRREANLPGVPKCSFGTCEDFFEYVSRTVDGSKLPVWNDELYLELHRACQTTQARTKRNNRKCELLYRDAEMLSAAALLLGGDYPQAALQEGWEQILCNQFHDILPGSSINEVYRDADRDYAWVRERGEQVRQAALGAILCKMDTGGAGIPVAVFNTLSWERTDVVTVKVRSRATQFAVTNAAGTQVPCQVTGRAKGEVEIVFLAENVPSLGYEVYRVLPGTAPKRFPGLRASKTALENDFVRVRLDGVGRVKSVYDKCAGREVLAPGESGNRLQCFDDRPFAHDAWDIDLWFEEKAWEVDDVQSVELVEAGPVRAVVRFTKRTEKSQFVQDVILYRHTPRLDFCTGVEWQEKRVLLKVAFPVDVLTSKATYEIQFGAIERPTHHNTSWDYGRFEVTGHKWADLSEGDYGVSLLNDCKYGHDIKGNVLRLSLLRASTSPDPHADEGHHLFTYSLYPHQGDWRRGGTVREGYALNVPLLAVATEAHAGCLPSRGTFAGTDRPNVIIDCIKKAEDSDDLILRLYEAHGQRGQVQVTLSPEFRKVVETNAIEEGADPVAFADGVLSLYLKPFEFRTFRLKR